MPEGSRTTFDRKTHRRKLERTTRLVYFYLVAQLLESDGTRRNCRRCAGTPGRSSRSHLETWGEAEIARLGAASVADLNGICDTKITEAFGDQADDALWNTDSKSKR